MDLDNVHNAARRAEVDLTGVLTGVRVKLNKSVRGVYGQTHPGRPETIELYRDAFKNEEQLVKTIAHERSHVDQLRQNGGRRPRNLLNMNAGKLTLEQLKPSLAGLSKESCSRGAVMQESSEEPL